MAKARALLGAIYNHPSDYNDDCTEYKENTRMAKPTKDFATKDNLINLYPNPNNGNFTLSYYIKDRKDAEVVIEDITGKLIYQSKMDTNSNNMILHLTNVRGGIYFVKIMNGKEIISVNKVIIQ
ncbi:MAG: T9SS type A sorting domain-containing protein [Burkholderiales bacterium]|nr:T9SS type A sorting domain-containing protein [Bacteroidia bacterium]